LENIYRLRAIRNGDKHFTSLPYLGWTVVGHEWKLYIIWKEELGAVVGSPFVIALLLNKVIMSYAGSFHSYSYTYSVNTKLFGHFQIAKIDSKCQAVVTSDLLPLV